MALEWQSVGLDTWQARLGAYRYQLRETRTPQHGPWFLDVYLDGESEPRRALHLHDRAQGERLAETHAAYYRALTGAGQ